MIDFEMSEEQKQIKALIKDFCEKEADEKYINEVQDKVAVSKTVQDVRAVYPRGLMEKLHRVGIRQLPVPTEYGGGGFGVGGHITRTIAAEQLGYGMGIAARLLTVPWMHVVNIASPSTTQAQKDFYFNRYMANPAFFSAVATSEPSGATDIFTPYDGPGGLMNTTAIKEGNDWVINGDKMFSSAAPVADLIQVTARVDKTKPLSQSMVSFWVQKDAPGLTYTLNKFMINEMCGNAQTHFDNVRVPDVQRIGGGSIRSMAGYAAKMAMFADMLGHTQKIFDNLVEYAKQRIQGGRPIIKHPNVAALIGEMDLHLEATRAFLYRAAWGYDQQEKAGVALERGWSAGGMFLVKKMCWRMCEIITEVYGGIGASVDMASERYMRRVLTWTPPGQSPQMQTMMFSMERNRHVIW